MASGKEGLDFLVCCSIFQIVSQGSDVIFFNFFPLRKRDIWIRRVARWFDAMIPAAHLYVGLVEEASNVSASCNGVFLLIAATMSTPNHVFMRGMNFLATFFI